MRIVHLVHVRFWNASAQYAIDLAAAQMRAGHDVTVYTAAGEPAARKARELGIPLWERSMGALDWLDILRDIRRLGRGADVLNAHHSDLQTAAHIAFPGADRPLIVRTRVDVREPKGGLLTRTLYNRRLDLVVVPGDDSRLRYENALGIRPEILQVVYGGVDTDRFRPDANRRAALRAELGIPDDAPVFLFVGRLQPVKAPEVYIEAAALMRAVNRRAHFILAGRPVDDHGWEHYRSLVDHFEVPDFHFLGEVDDIPGLMAAADIGVITSVASEAHCRVGLEMMASGLPVIGAETGVIPEVVKHGETGYIVRSRDAAELAMAMERMASDLPLRRQMSETARRTMETEFSFPAWVENTRRAYRRARAMRP